MPTTRWLGRLGYDTEFNWGSHLSARRRRTDAVLAAAAGRSERAVGEWHCNQQLRQRTEAQLSQAQREENAGFVDELHQREHEREKAERAAQFEANKVSGSAPARCNSVCLRTPTAQPPLGRHSAACQHWLPPARPFTIVASAVRWKRRRRHRRLRRR